MDIFSSLPLYVSDCVHFGVFFRCPVKGGRLPRSVGIAGLAGSLRRS